MMFGMMILGKRESMYIWVLAVFVFFPTCIYFTQSPQLSPQQILLYAFFALTGLFRTNDLKMALVKLPVKVPLFLLLVSLLLTAFVSGEGGKGIYNAMRCFMENYAYWIIAFMGGLCYKEIKLENKFVFPVIFLFVFGVVEFVMGENYIFKFICQAFPYYDGYYDLNGFVSAARTYRSRIFITTIHPTTLGTMLCCSLLFFTCLFPKVEMDVKKKVVIWCVLFVLIILCGSRTALACSILGLALFLFLKMKAALKIICVISVAFAVSYYAQSVIEQFNVEGQGSSISLRQEQLLFSYLQFMNSPVLGNGVRYTSKFIMERDTYNDRVTDAEIGGLESVVFYQLIDYGIVGIVAYFSLFLVALIYFIKRRDCEYARAGLLMTIAFFIYACMSGEIGGNNVIAYLLIGYCMGATYKHERDEEEEQTLLKNEIPVEREEVNG